MKSFKSFLSGIFRGSDKVEDDNKTSTNNRRGIGNKATRSKSESDDATKTEDQSNEDWPGKWESAVSDQE